MITEGQKKGSKKIEEAVKYTTGAGSSSAGKGCTPRTFGKRFEDSMERIFETGTKVEQVECLECECVLDVDNIKDSDRTCICGAVLFSKNGKPTKKAKLL